MPRIAGGTRVEWTLRPRFSDPVPHEFRLEVGAAGSHLADDWEVVGFPAEDTFYLLDDEQRVYGKSQWTHYRVRLRTSQGVYYSEPVNCLGSLGFRHWRIFQEVLRRELLMFRMETGQEGCLLKMRYAGPKCTACLDYQSEEVSNASCSTCYGTGVVGGYYAPIPCVYAAPDPLGTNEKLDGGQARGMINDVVTRARMLASPQLARGDVWVDKDTDRRWKIHEVANIAEVRGVPAVCMVAMHLVGFSDPLYQLEMPDQVPDESPL